MGTSRTAAEFVGKIDRAAKNVEAANKAAVKRSAQALVAAANANIAAATGGDGHLSGMGRTKKGQQRGRIVAVSKSATIGTESGALVKVLGPAPLVESDVAPHYVFPKGARAGGARGRTKTFRDREGKRSTVNIASVYAGALGDPSSVDVGPHRLKFGKVYLTYTVASSTGRHPWRHAREATEPAMPRIFAAEQAKGVAEAFR